MSKIYFIYASISEDVFNKRIKYFIDSRIIHKFRWKHGKLYGMYAWTTDKKKVKDFLETRNGSIYTVIKKDVEDKDEELKRLRREYGEQELNYYSFRHDDPEEMIILTTKNEYTISTDNIEEYLYEFGGFNDYLKYDYRVFNEEIQLALDILNYNTQYDTNIGKTESIEYARYNSSFRVTPLGRTMTDFTYNEANVLLYFFEYMFIGDVNEDKEELT